VCVELAPHKNRSVDANPKKCYIPDDKRKNPFKPSTCLSMIRKMKMRNSVDVRKVCIGFEEQAFRLLTQTRAKKEDLENSLKKAIKRAETYEKEEKNDF